MSAETCPRCGQPGRLFTYPDSGTPPQQDCHRCRARFKAQRQRHEKRRAKARAKTHPTPEPAGAQVRGRERNPRDCQHVLKRDLVIGGWYCPKCLTNFGEHEP